MWRVSGHSCATCTRNGARTFAARLLTDPAGSATRPRWTRNSPHWASTERAAPRRLMWSNTCDWRPPSANANGRVSPGRSPLGSAAHDLVVVGVAFAERELFVVRRAAVVAAEVQI